MHPNNIKAGELSGQCHGSKLCTGALYIDGYIGDGKPKGDWLKKRTEKWESDVHALRKTSDKYPQKSYSTAAREVQPDWIFLQQVTKITGQAFAELKHFCRKPF